MDYNLPHMGDPLGELAADIIEFERLSEQYTNGPLELFTEQARTLKLIFEQTIPTITRINKDSDEFKALQLGISFLCGIFQAELTKTRDLLGNIRVNPLAVSGDTNIYGMQIIDMDNKIRSMTTSINAMKLAANSTRQSNEAKQRTLVNSSRLVVTRLDEFLQSQELAQPNRQQSSLPDAFDSIAEIIGQYGNGFNLEAKEENGIRTEGPVHGVHAYVLLLMLQNLIDGAKGLGGFVSTQVMRVNISYDNNGFDFNVNSLGMPSEGFAALKHGGLGMNIERLASYLGMRVELGNPQYNAKTKQPEGLKLSFRFVSES